MKKTKIEGKQLRALGYPESPVISMAMKVVKEHFRFEPLEDVLVKLKAVLDEPGEFVNDPILGGIAAHLMPPVPDASQVALNTSGIGFAVYGRDHIEEGALHQMHIAAKLPVAVGGALMPDAHHGYGLPIGGVLATDNAVIPYGVGVDIGCRMCLSIFDLDPKELVQKENYFAREINEATLFGSGAQFTRPADHAVMEHKAFDELPLLRSLQGKAWKQLGSSGSGNHFVEFGVVEISEQDNILNVPAGKYVGLLSHSGSRGLGANIANHYTRLAKDIRRLPGEASNLAWFTLDESAGQEYWISMNLAGDYASACHHVIHDKIARQLGRKPLTRVENHHNFAWKEFIQDEQGQKREVIVHRKGATPAGRDVLGIIPGSMTADGFIVKGKGERRSIQSASHGAGRKMSRSAAMKSVTHSALREELEKHGVKLLGGGLDEAPFAYKDIRDVMKSQVDLVDVVGRFTPKIVKMDGTAPKPWRKKKETGGVDGE